jgi:hypothetical protein
MLFCLLVLAGISCDKAGSKIIPLDGKYIGYFHRNNEDTAQISINFIDNNFQEINFASIDNQPCAGSFIQNENVIIFNNTCLGLLNPEAPLVLDKTYFYKFNEDGTLRIWRQSGLLLDEYILKKPVN